MSLDDPSCWTDEGAVYEAFYVTNPVNFGKAAPQGKLRHIAQAVTLTAPTVVTITPLGDGNEYDDQATAVSVDPSLGATQVVEAEPAVDGQRFSYKVAPTGFTGPVAFGEADISLVKKRT